MKINTDKNLIADAVKKYSDTVFRIAFQYTRNRLDAEDIVQEVFLQLLKSPTPTNDDGWQKAWLIRIAINKCKDFLRTKKRRQKNAYIPPAEPDLHPELFDALEKLNERDRNALYLHYYEGYTALEIADILGEKERAITKRICRAREKLKKFLEE